MGDGSLGQLVAGRYELVGVLGEGTFGVVYDGIHRVIGRRVAVKILRENIDRDPILVERFQLEARAAGALGHPNIVQIFDAGQVENGPHFLVMERVDGQSLFEELSSGPLAIARAVDITMQVLAGLSAAHRRSIVHRDLKPENILLGRDEEGREVAKIADFGISKVLDPKRIGVPEMRVTGYGEVLGTPLYMAPEQAVGEADIDHRADIWAVGCVLYEMVCGRPPFLGESYPQILAALLRDPPLMPGTLRAEVTPALESVIMAALHKDRQDRPADAVRMREMLAAAASGMGTAPAGGADDAAMMDALSRAVALELAEGGGASPPTQAVAPPPAAEAPPAPLRVEPPRARAHTPPPDDMFAPPQEAAGPLALEVDSSVLRTSQRRTVIDSPPARSLPVAVAARRGFPVAGLFTFLVVAAILAGGGLALYRYLTLGYVWRAGTGGVKLQLAMTPADAEVMLDGAPLDADRFSVEDGSRHELVARAPGRLAIRRELRGDPAVRQLEIRLSNALRPLSAAPLPAASSGPPLPRPEGSAADLDQALAKLDLYRACLALVAPNIESARAAYQRSARSVPPEIELLAATQVDQCRADVERARGLTPSLGPVDAAGGAFADALVELDTLARRLATYYQTGEYRVDGRKLGRRNHEPLLEAYGVALTRAGELMELVERSTSDWQAHEVDFLRERDAAHRVIRRVALAARRRARAEIRAGGDDRAAAGAELEQALAAVPQPAAEGKDVLAIAAAAPSGGAPADWIAWHDRLVTAFNQLETR